MWAKLKPSKITLGVEEELRQVGKSLNVNEEYLSALRTKSYGEFLSKAHQILANHHHYHHHKFSETLLEPGQESIPKILEESTLLLSKIPELKTLLLNYFDITAEASKFCSHLLKGINQIKSTYLLITQVFDEIDYDEEYYFSIHENNNVKLIVSELNYALFLTPNKLDFKLIHDKYSSVLKSLKSMRKKVTKKIKIIKCFQKASGICIAATCGVIALAAHTATAVFVGPVIFSFPIKRMARKISDLPFLRSGVLRKVGDRLDLAAKGTYILSREYNTMNRLVVRVQDGLEHNKELLESCLERREHRFCLQVVKELIKKGDLGFRRHVEELEEHVYLCLVNINRARNSVIKEMN
ncbi:UPF0496 protein At1g20180-like [Humulus lupulus]|uniref:UPF0496 protein At1g20180-like n=1 Tax=Humulus lupulus TaxID=3486 RepID=UPI002B402BA1|nr:UPF0496 protein At1g20180-like [Humulus lupulus]